MVDYEGLNLFLGFDENMKRISDLTARSFILAWRSGIPEFQQKEEREKQVERAILRKTDISPPPPLPLLNN